MRNISPERAMVSQARQMVISGMLCLLIGLVAFACGGMLIVIPLSIAAWYSVIQGVLLALAALFLLIGVIQLIRGWRFPVDNPHALKMAQFLERFLDYRYTYIRNIAGKALGTVDAVLVGPNGVLVFCFFAQKGSFYSERNVWLRQTGRELRPAGVNPTQEAARAVGRLRDLFRQRGLGDIPTYAIIVAAYPDTAVQTQQPVIPIAHMPEVRAALADNYLSRERIRPDQVENVVRVIMQSAV